MKRFLSLSGMAMALVAGIVGGLALAVLTSPLPAFSYNQVFVVSWRGGDAVPANVATTGWSAPMFYTTADEGASPSGPAGLFPTGVWAPGDTVARTLTVRNTDPGRMMQLTSIGVRLSGDLELSPWMDLTVRDESGALLFQGSVSQFTGTTDIPFAHPVTLRLGAQTDLIFGVSLSRDTDQRHQGKTVKADFVLSAVGVTIPALIDIHPSSWPNPVRPGGSGSTPVAVNGTTALDVRTLNWETARFGPAQVPPLKAGGYEDWNRDGREDLILHFSTRDSGIQCGMTSASLTIASYTGEVYEGTDAIVTVPCD